MLIGVLALGFVLRLPFAFLEFCHHPDEIWQYVEPAYGLDFGRAIVTWEYRAGVRSWLIPELFAGPVWLGKTFFSNTAFPMLPLHLTLAVLSLAIIFAGFVIGSRISRVHALAAGLVLALGFEPIFLAARPLSDTLSTVALLVAAMMLTDARASARAWAVGGLLLGLAISVRLQTAVAAGVLVIFACGLDARKWGWVVLGGLGGLLVDGLADLAMGATPFRWMIENYRMNLIEHVSERYGIEPRSWYLVRLAEMCGPLWPLLMILIGLGVRRAPLLFAVAVLHLLVHSMVPHKEMRFIFPSVVLFLLIGGLGSADALLWAARRGQRAGIGALAIVSLIWLSSAALSALDAKNNQRFSCRSLVTMWRAAHDEPKLCGLATLRTEDVSMAYAYINRSVPIYKFSEPDAEGAILRNAPAYNMIVASQTRAPLLARAGYSQRRCFVGQTDLLRGTPASKCEYVRSGPCDADIGKSYEENEVRKRLKI